jgi:hypothetical protein
MLVAGIAAFLILLSIRNAVLAGRRTRSGDIIRRVSVTTLAIVICVVFLAAFELAMSLASDSVTERFTTLMGENKSEVYYSSRGLFVDETVNILLPQYPLGAGLGRWGMVNYYFGDNTDPQVPPLWVEIQWTGWLFDGGVPLIVVYICALWLALMVTMKIALGRNRSDLGIYATLLFTYDIGAIVDTFDSPFFAGQSGLEFWFLNAMLFAAVLDFRAQDGGRA